MVDLNQLGDAIERGDRDAAKALTQAAIEEGLHPQGILDVMTAAMDVVGRRFQRQEIFIPEMLIAARAMKEATALLEPLLVQAGFKPVAKAVIGTVEGDLHDIGKNLVVMMWRGANIEVIDLGANASPEKFVAAVREHQPQLVGLSALLTTTMPAMRRTLEAFHDAGLYPFKTLIGGAPVTPRFAEEIGADGYAADAASAVDAARKLLKTISG